MGSASKEDFDRYEFKFQSRDFEDEWHWVETFRTPVENGDLGWWHRVGARCDRGLLVPQRGGTYGGGPPKPGEPYSVCAQGPPEQAPGFSSSTRTREVAQQRRFRRCRLTRSRAGTRTSWQCVAPECHALPSPVAPERGGHCSKEWRQVARCCCFESMGCTRHQGSTEGLPAAIQGRASYETREMVGSHRGPCAGRRDNLGGRGWPTSANRVAERRRDTIAR